MTARSNKPDTRNPLLALPSAALIAALPNDAKIALGAILKDMRTDAQRRAAESWRKHKAPMACYWKGVAVYAGHTARLCRVSNG